jgi:hypothetical protein
MRRYSSSGSYDITVLIDLSIAILYESTLQDLTQSRTYLILFDQIYVAQPSINVQK